MVSGALLSYQKDMQIITLLRDNTEADTGPTEGEGGSYLSKEVRGGNEEMLELSLMGEVCFLRTKGAGVRK